MILDLHKIHRMATPPAGFEWAGGDAPGKATQDWFTGKKNQAKSFHRIDPELYHGTSQEVAGKIRLEGLKAIPEWGQGRKGIFVWEDLGSALNWANYWYGDDGCVVQITDGEAVKEIYQDLDQGNAFWHGYLSLRHPPRAWIIPHDVPPEALYVQNRRDYQESLEEHREEAEGEEDYLDGTHFVEHEESPPLAKAKDKL